MHSVSVSCPICGAEEAFTASFTITPEERQTYEYPGWPEERELDTSFEPTCCPDCGALLDPDEYDSVVAAAKEAMEAYEPDVNYYDDSDEDAYDMYFDR